MDSTSTVRSTSHGEADTTGCSTTQVSAGKLTRTDQPSGTVDPQQRLAELYGPILAPLKEVELRLSQELQSRYAVLTPVLQHGTQLGGKRLRPAMLLLSGAAAGGVQSDHVVLATVIEMVHTATLVHDDVLDKADTRRHVPTINARWNEDTSILLGDYLFAQSFRLAATLPSTEACRWIGEAARLVCEGELRQVLRRDMVELDEPTYFDMIRGKTAELCRVACQLGAKYSETSAEVVDAFAAYGNAVGIAFQIADDYLDLWGSDETVGKTLGTDIQQGKMTLPIIRLLATANEADREQIIGILRGPSDVRLNLIRPFLHNCDAQDYTHEVADRFRCEAMEALEIVPDSAAKASLIAIANFSVDRRF
ncbi:MAG: polyprenyl synthetase family protein [Rubripirellula sp.]